jgi:hypothetical protein
MGVVRRRLEDLGPSGQRGPASDEAVCRVNQGEGAGPLRLALARRPFLLVGRLVIVPPVGN